MRAVLLNLRTVSRRSRSQLHRAGALAAAPSSGQCDSCAAPCGSDLGQYRPSNRKLAMNNSDNGCVANCMVCNQKAEHIDADEPNVLCNEHRTLQGRGFTAIIEIDHTIGSIHASPIRWSTCWRFAPGGTCM